MKNIFIGAKLNSEQHHKLRVIAANKGESISSLLKKTVVELIAKDEKKGGAK